MTTASAIGIENNGVVVRTVPPSKLAHFVLRTSRYDAIIDWYTATLHARVVFRNEQLAFLTYDEEHHRLAVLNMPGLSEQLENVAGVHHIAFTWDTLKDLLENYERLSERGINPIYTINHGPTTSIYYRDPDGNQLEFQVENFADAKAGRDYFHSEAFAENPIGVEFDPDKMLAQLRMGKVEEVLTQRPDVGPRGIGDVKLR